MQFTFFKRIAPLFLVVMMLCMTLSVTAFAAEAEIPDGWTVLGNGESVTFTASPQVKKLIPVTEGTTYTFAGDSQFGVFMGVKANGTTETIGRANDMGNSYTADGTYQWITISCYNVSSITGSVTWPEPTLADEILGIMAGIGACFTGSLSWVGNVGNAIMSTPLLFAGAVGIPLVGLGIVLFKRIFKRG